MSPRVIALADDLTGAIETGAQFAHLGFTASVTLWPRTEPSRRCDVFVADAETRHLSAADARDRICSLAEQARALGFDLLYLKTDSTLRGNIGPSLEALAEVFPKLDIVYAPAYPALGRTVKNGFLFVDGIPVQDTGFARDPLNPVRGNHIRSAIGEHSRVQINDGITDSDVATVAKRILETTPRPLAAGPASLAGHLARLIRNGNAHPPVWPRVRKASLINGSAHPLSAQQASHRWCDVPREDADALVIFGGDTAFATLSSLGCDEVFPIGEIVPGVPVSRMAVQPYFVITKAGGFGPVDVLSRIENLLC